MPHTKTIFEWALASVKVFCQLLAVSAEVFLRHSFGRRYAGTLVASLLVFSLYAFSVFDSGRRNGAPLIAGFLFIYFVLVMFHLTAAWTTRIAPVHSRLPGQSWGFWRGITTNPRVVQIALEPLACLMVGIVVTPVDEPLASWLICASMSLFVKECIRHWERTQRMLDAVDARIEGERVGTAVRDHFNPESTDGRRFHPVGSEETPQQPGPSDYRAGLDPALRRLMTQVEPPSAPSSQPNPAPRPRTASPAKSHPSPHHAGPLGHLPRITGSRWNPPQ